LKKKREELDFCALKERHLGLVFVSGVADARIMQKPLGTEASLYWETSQ